MLATMLLSWDGRQKTQEMKAKKICQAMKTKWNGFNVRIVGIYRLCLALDCKHFYILEASFNDKVIYNKSRKGEEKH